jgi:hypothetical protein
LFALRLPERTPAAPLCRKNAAGSRGAISI